MSKATPGPWHVRVDVTAPIGSMMVVGPRGGKICTAREANARLIAAAPDHALVAKAIVWRIARWEAFAPDGHSSNGELCFDGLRYCSDLDEFGVPRLDEVTRPRLLAAIEAATAGGLSQQETKKS